MKLYIKLVVCILIISLAFSIGNIGMAGMADWTREESEKKANEEIAQQEKEVADNIEKSSNNYLSSLSVEGYKLIPEFDKQTINYSIELPVDSDSLKVNANADDSRATVLGAGSVPLQSGENNIEINVKAENGRMRTYYIKVNKRVDDNSLKLKRINIKAVEQNGDKYNIELTPTFSESIYSYSCSVENNINKIDIEFEGTNNTSIDIKGNNDLKEGNNPVTITVKSNITSKETVYKIDVFKKSNSLHNETNISSNNATAIIITIAVVIGFVAIAFGYKKSHKKQSKH